MAEATSQKKTRSPYLLLLYIAAGEAAVIAVIAIVYLVIGKFHWSVLTGAAAGAAIGIFNQFLLMLSAGRAFDKARAKRGSGEMTEEEIKEFSKKHENAMRLSVTLSFVLRLVLLGGLLVLAFLLPKVFAVIPAVVALVAVQLLIIVFGLFDKKKDAGI